MTRWLRVSLPKVSHTWTAAMVTISSFHDISKGYLAISEGIDANAAKRFSGWCSHEGFSYCLISIQEIAPCLPLRLVNGWICVECQKFPTVRKIFCDINQWLSMLVKVWLFMVDVKICNFRVLITRSSLCSTCTTEWMEILLESSSFMAFWLVVFLTLNGPRRQALSFRDGHAEDVLLVSSFLLRRRRLQLRILGEYNFYCCLLPGQPVPVDEKMLHSWETHPGNHGTPKRFVLVRSKGPLIDLVESGDSVQDRSQWGSCSLIQVSRSYMQTP